MAETPDLSEIIGKLTEDPETLGKVMNLASNLMGNAKADTREGTPPENSPVSPSENQMPAFDPAMLASVFSGLGAVTGGDKKDNGGKGGDSRTALLHALKPYMSPERAEKIDMMIKAMKLADIAGGLLGNSDFLK